MVRKRDRRRGFPGLVVRTTELFPRLVLLSTALLVSCPVANPAGTLEPARPDTTAVFDGGDDEDDEVLDGGPAEEDGGVDALLESLWDERRLGRVVPLEQGPLHPLFESLAAVERDGEGLVRVLHYGDSHTAADFMTTALRRGLQARFGAGGRGFVLLGQPWRSYRPKDVELGARGDWRAERIRIGADPVALDGRYGLGGVITEASDAGTTTWVSTTKSSRFGRKASAIEIWYLEQPRGGSFVLYLDGKRHRKVHTRARRLGTGFLRLELPAGEHSVRLRLQGNGVVRLFGAVVEADGPGIVYDTLGVNGAFFHTPQRWDAALLAEQVERRDPRLIVTMYGANDADSRRIDRTAYVQTVKETVSRLKAGAPEAACLLLGPPDREMEEGHHRRSRLDEIIDAQAEAADEIGCAFVDLRELMGGPGSHARWVLHGLAQPDGIHLTVRGYHLLGELLASRIVSSYERFLEEREDPRPATVDADPAPAESTEEE